MSKSSLSPRVNRKMINGGTLSVIETSVVQCLLKKGPVAFPRVCRGLGPFSLNALAGTGFGLSSFG